MMFWRKVKIVLGILCFSLLIVFAGWVAAKSKGMSTFLFASPDTPRPQASTWDRFHLSAVTPFTPRDIMVDTQITSGSSSDVRVSTPSPPDSSKNYFPITEQEAKFGDSVVLGTSTLRLAYIGVSCPLPPRMGSEDRDRVERFYGPDLTTATAPSAEYGRISTRAESTYPAYSFHFETKGKFGFSNITLLDARTHQALTSGYGSSSKKDKITYRLDIHMWHPAPVDLVVQIPEGETKTVEFDATSGAGLRDGNFDLRFIQSFNGHGWGSSNTPSGKAVFTFSPGPGNPVSQSFFVCQPQAPPLLQITLLDKNGKEVETSGTGVSDRSFVMVSSESPCEEIAKIRVTYAPASRYLTFHLPELPGLPEENRNINNLAAVRVPYVIFRQQWDLHEYFQNMLQCQVARTIDFAPLFAKGMPPLEFTSKTVDEIAQDVARKSNADVQINSNGAIEFTPHQTLSEKFQTWVAEIRRLLKI